MNTTLRKVIVVIAAFLTTIVMNAQTIKDVVYLKNGSIIRGLVLEQIPNETLKIQTADGSIFVYQMSEVQKIVKEEITSDRSNTDTSLSNVNNRNKAGWNEFTFDLGYGNTHYTGKGDADVEDVFSLSFNYARGIHLNRHNGWTLRPGIGVYVGSYGEEYVYHSSSYIEYDYHDITIVSITPKVDFGYHITWQNSSISLFPYAGITTRINLWGESDYGDGRYYDVFDSDEGDANRFQIGARVGFDAHFRKFVLGFTYEQDFNEISADMNIWTANLRLGWCF